VYRPCEQDLTQGDIVDAVPHLHLKLPLTIVRQVTLPGNRQAWAPYPYPPVEGQTPDAPGKTIKGPPFDVARGEYVPVHARFTRAIVLNYECDLAHNEDHCTVAIVRPIDGIHENDRPIIRENRNYSYFHLPADPDVGLEEGYADFRQLTSLHPDVIERVGNRRASLTPEAVRALQAAYYRFLTRRALIDPDVERAERLLRAVAELLGEGKHAEAADTLRQAGYA
jgi:hypothetical protein